MKKGLVILVFALIFRIILSFTGYHVDIYSNGGWGKWIHNNGYLGFYENNVWVYSWPTQPPLVNMVYSYSYNVYQRLAIMLNRFTGKATYILPPVQKLSLQKFTQDFSLFLNDTPLEVGYVFSIKLFSILSDICIASLIIYFFKKNKYKYLVASLFLFFPFSWYISSLWGQYDPVSFLLLFTSFLLLSKRKFIISSFLLSLSISIKPTGLIFVPVFLFYYFSYKPKLTTVLLSILLTLSFFFFTISLFTNDNLFQYLYHRLYPLIFKKSEARLTTVSFNFWWIMVGKTNTAANYKFIFIPANIWGYLVYIFTNIVVFFRFKKPTQKNIIISLYLIGVGSFLFLTNMLERYVYAGVVSMFFLLYYYPKLWKLLLITIVIFSLNLHYSWSFPESWISWEKILKNNLDLTTRLLAFLNVVIYSLSLRYLITMSYTDKKKLNQ